MLRAAPLSVTIIFPDPENRKNLPYVSEPNGGASVITVAWWCPGPTDPP